MTNSAATTAAPGVEGRGGGGGGVGPGRFGSGHGPTALLTSPASHGFCWVRPWQKNLEGHDMREIFSWRYEDVSSGCGVYFGVGKEFIGFLVICLRYVC